MSDFFHSGWSVFVAALTLLSVVACLWILMVGARRRVIAGVTDNSTGHVWDGDLKELNNPLPKWWMGLFVLTVLFGLGYLAWYPGLGSFAGSSGWSSASEVEADDSKMRASLVPLYANFATMDEATLVKDASAMAVGERLFVNHCATCHGSDAQGSKGFPNLADGDWLWGGDLKAIKTSIAEGRQGVMPPMAAAVGSPEEIRQLAHHVLSLSGAPHDRLAAQFGKAKFGACAACHGLDGKGNVALGAPNLTDKVWLHGYGESLVIALINEGKTNVMPAHAARLSAEQIHVLAGYVKQLAKAP